MKIRHGGARALARAATILLLVLFWAGTGHAQSPYSSNVEGAVQDPSGAAVPNATVGLSNSATQVAAHTTTDSAGNYRFVSLGLVPMKSPPKRPASQRRLSPSR